MAYGRNRNGYGALGSTRNRMRPNYGQETYSSQNAYTDSAYNKVATYPRGDRDIGVTRSVLAGLGAADDMAKPNLLSMGAKLYPNLVEKTPTTQIVEKSNALTNRITSDVASEAAVRATVRAAQNIGMQETGTQPPAPPSEEADTGGNWWTRLSGMQKALAVAGGVAVLGGVYYVATR